MIVCEPRPAEITVFSNKPTKAGHDSTSLDFWIIYRELTWNEKCFFLLGNCNKLILLCKFEGWRQAINPNIWYESKVTSSSESLITIKCLFTGAYMISKFRQPLSHVTRKMLLSQQTMSHDKKILRRWHEECSDRKSLTSFTYWLIHHLESRFRSLSVDIWLNRLAASGTAQLHAIQYESGWKSKLRN